MTTSTPEHDREGSGTRAEPIPIVLVDDHVVVRQGLRMLLDNEPGFRVVGEASRSREAVDLAARERPAVVLLDLDLGGESALDAIPQLLAAGPGVRVLILTGVPDGDLHRQAIRRGASGVVLKDQAGELLVKAIRCVVAGEVWIERGMTAAILEEMRGAAEGRAIDPHAARIATLTPREREIVALVAQGHGTQKLAAMLFISEKTVRNHLASIYSKLDVSERLELALYAVKHGLT